MSQLFFISSIHFLLASQHAFFIELFIIYKKNCQFQYRAERKLFSKITISLNTDLQKKKKKKNLEYVTIKYDLLKNHCPHCV